MNIYINNIKITLLANAGSLNVGTTLNMVKNSTSKGGAGQFKPKDIIPGFKGETPIGQKIGQEIEEVPFPDIQIPTVD